MYASKPLQLGLVALVGLFAARSYYHWLTGSGALMEGLRRFGEAGYWSLLAIPSLVLFVAFFLIFRRPQSANLFSVVAGAVLASICVAYLGFLGDFLFCAFISRGTCD